MESTTLHQLSWGKANQSDDFEFWKMVGSRLIMISMMLSRLEWF
jgi:hypothetical protein